MHLETTAPPRVVSTYNEWDPLQEVIVGSVKGAQHMAYEPSLGAYFPPGPAERGFRGSRWPQQDVDAAERQLDGLARLLEERGIIVRRPEPFPAEGGVCTPDFEIPFGNCYACPRDVLFVLGNQIIEAPMSQRGRFFEYRGYRQLLRGYSEAGAQWIAAPKPLMDDASYVPDYSTHERAFDVDAHPVLLTADPCFDGASFTRLGRDIIWQPDLVSNEQGRQWLQRIIGPDYRIHRAEFDDRYPQHIDTTLVPLRNGIVLMNTERPPKGPLVDLFVRSGWKVLYPPPSVRHGLPAPARDVSNWISINSLMLDPNTIVIEESELPFRQFLQELGFNVLTCRFDKVYKFGGGFHCCTIDIRREGKLERYLDV